MQTSNAKQSRKSNDEEWVLLAELSLGDFLSDHDWREGYTVGFLFQALRELGLSAECMENIARTLAGFTKEARARHKQGRPEFSSQIRIFCQKKRIEGANSAKPSRPSHIEQDKKQKQIYPDSGVGGWGYFMVERGEDLPPDSPVVRHNHMDLYLYKEGE
jgi:hypothetical protein